jgi:hypothetical protein
MRADVHRFSLSDPGDVSGLKAAFDAGLVHPTTIVAVIGKTHGNGLVNDYTRGYLLTLCLSKRSRRCRTPWSSRRWAIKSATKLTAHIASRTC